MEPTSETKIASEVFRKSELEAWAECQRSSTEVVSEPVVTFNRYGDYWLVGSGEQTNPECGTFKKFMGCLNVEAHNAVRLLVPNVPKDSIFVKSVYHSCDNPLCPKCYRYGWAVREAGRIEARMKEASKRFGLVEHIVVSVPDNDYGLSLEDLRSKCVKILSVRGVIGGCMIFHFFRYRNSIEARKSGLPIGWFPSPHFHVLG